MKKYKLYGVIILSICLCFLLGMLTQKTYGLGNVIRFLKPSNGKSQYTQNIDNNHYGKMSIYILAGQSNMEGDGDESTESLNDGKIYAFNDNYQWIKGREPIRKKVGPSMAIANKISKHSDKPIGVINVAVGGTNIAQWQKSYRQSSLYQKLLIRALASQTQGKIEGLFFLQGENDAEGDETDHYDDWHIYFEKFVKDLRKDLNYDSLPIIFGQIGKGNGKYWLKVKQSQEKVSIPNVEMIKTDDIEYKSGEIHYDSRGYMEIGTRFGEKYVNKFMNINNKN